MINNSSLKPIKSQLINGDIDWSFTKEWINHNPFDAPCSEKLSKIQSTKLKKINFIYPTVDIQQRNYPLLYPGGQIPYVKCNIIKDTNEHVGLCLSHTGDILKIMIDHEKILLDIIKNEISNNDYMLEASINGSRLFDRSFNGGLPSDHPFYLLIHHLVLCDLTEIFYNYIPKKKLRFNTFIKL
jgi:hypothetical protein